MKTQGLSRESILAGLPVAIYAIGLIVSWLWSPVLFQRPDYSLASLVVLVILVSGAAWGMAHHLPLWSYSWLIFALLELSRLVGASLAESTASAREYGVVLSLPGTAALFVVIVMAALLSLRGMRFAMFAILLSLLYYALHFHILEESTALSTGTANTVTWVLAILAVAEAVFAVFLVARFLSNQGKLQTRSLYLLAAIIFADALLNGWSLGLTVSGGSVLDTLIAAVATIGSTWITTGITLLLVWGLAKLTLRLTGRRVSKATP